MKLSSSIFQKIRRRTAKLGVRYERVPKPGHWDKVPYWYVWFKPGEKRYLIKGQLTELAIKYGWITHDDLRQARGRTEIPIKCPKEPF